MVWIFVKDDQQQVWQNLSLSLSLTLLTAQQCYEAQLSPLVFYSLLHVDFCCQQIAPLIGRYLVVHAEKRLGLSSVCQKIKVGAPWYLPDSIISPRDI